MASLNAAREKVQPKGKGTNVLSVLCVLSFEPHLVLGGEASLVAFCVQKTEALVVGDSLTGEKRLLAQGHVTPESVLSSVTPESSSAV